MSKIAIKICITVIDNNVTKRNIVWHVRAVIMVTKLKIHILSSDSSQYLAISEI